jgi:Protein of unknown function (DUF2934)
MNAEGGTSMGKQAPKCLNNWVITVESSREQHQEIIRSTVARRAYEIFERRGCEHGFDQEDWVAAEKELLRDDFDGNTSQFRFFIECPRDPEVTTILSLTTHSMIVFRSHARHAGEVGGGPDVASVHLFPEEIDTTKTNVNGVDGLLHVQIPKRNHRNSA